MAATPELAGQPLKLAMIGARNATHMTSALPQTFASPVADIARFPVTLPIDQIVAGLNAYQPLVLMGYPSMLALLAAEPVDLAGRPVPPGVRSDKLYVTAISNPTLPLIRFELTDQVTVLDRACPCGSAHTLIADVQGRLDDAFTYPGGQVVHPHVFRSLLGRDRGVVEYQVGQTSSGAEVLVVGAPADPAALGRRIAAELARLGLPDPSVEVRVVDQLVRQATGKARRFRPLTEAEEVARPA
jgi:hypothetical protein